MPEGSLRIAAISGGLGDIGQASAIALASQGTDIAVGDIRADHRVDQLRHKVERLGRRFHFTQLDVADCDSVRRWFQELEQQLGIADIAVANAAVVEQCVLREMTQQVWHQQLDTNLTGAMHMANIAALRMAASQRQGRIVLVGSWAAQVPHTHIPAYCVSKAGLRMLCRLLALEYAAEGIRVIEVAPGIVDAGLSRQLFDKHPGLRERMTKQVPLRRLMTPEEVAWQIAQACDPKNQCMTGATITCDGGASLYTSAEGA